MKLNPRQIHEKLQNGDPLANVEVLEGAAFFKDLADRLLKCGPVFHLAAKEANRCYLNLDGFAQARGLNRDY